MGKKIIRTATEHDLARINEIYNHAVVHTTATFDTVEKTLDERKAWFAKHHPKYPVLVWEDEGKILGWASLTQWSERCAYDDTAENSVYVDPAHHGKGIGKALLAKLVEESRAKKFHTLIARIADGNPVSTRLHTTQGFETIGVMKQVGFKFGKRLDVLMMQIILK